MRVFFLSWSRPHRDLHSFPTRRSSDLLRAHRLADGAATGPDAVAGLRRARGRRSRSEEHTSELQSQSNLVCRLLLEKKKRKEHPVTGASLFQSRPGIPQAVAA